MKGKGVVRNEINVNVSASVNANESVKGSENGNAETKNETVQKSGQEVQFGDLHLKGVDHVL